MSQPAALNGMSLNDLMGTKNFGRTSLRNLLAALETATGRSCLAGGSEPLHNSTEERLPQGHVGLTVDAEADRRAKRRSLDVAVEFMRLEQVLGPEVIRARDPRFGSYLRAAAPGCSDTSMLLALDPSTLVMEAGYEGRLKALSGLRSVVEGARRLPLLSELEAIVMSFSTATHGKIILRFWGWDGRGGTTLQQVADEYGISRERVRQVASRARGRLGAGGRLFAPVAARALETAQGMAPTTASTLASALAGEALIPFDSELQFLGELAEALGRSAVIRFDVPSGCFVSTKAGEGSVREVSREASRLARKYGTACVEDVYDALRSQLPEPPHPEGVSRFLRTRSDLLWLDNDHRWFCKREIDGNPVLRRVHKVVAVAGRVRLSELRGGVARDYRLRTAVPPKAILLKLCSLDPCLKIEAEVVAGREGAVLHPLLSPTERNLWRVLLDNGSVMEHAQLERAWISNGFGRPSLQAALTYSPVVVRYAPQVYGLRGVPIPPGAVESVQLRRNTRKSRYVLDSGWTANGVRLVYRLSEASVSNGIVGIPASFARSLERDFRLTRLGNPVGTLRCRGAQGWGLGPLFRRVGAEAGDTLTLEFDLQKSEAQASLATEGPDGGEGLLSASAPVPGGDTL
jgi:hypothetical protein